jgi:hypothetical protein
VKPPKLSGVDVPFAHVSAAPDIVTTPAVVVARILVPELVAGKLSNKRLSLAILFYLSKTKR